MSWVKTHGKGRVFFSAFGHSDYTFWNPTLLAALPRGHSVRARRSGSRRQTQESRTRARRRAERARRRAGREKRVCGKFKGGQSTRRPSAAACIDLREDSIDVSSRRAKLLQTGQRIGGGTVVGELVLNRPPDPGTRREPRTLGGLADESVESLRHEHLKSVAAHMNRLTLTATAVRGAPTPPSRSRAARERSSPCPLGFTRGAPPTRLGPAPTPARGAPCPRSYQFLSRMFRYSTFIGGPTCTWTPISPSAGRFGTSSSMTTLISRPLMM